MVLKAGERILIKKIRFARTILQRTKGLMFEEKKNFDYALIFEFPVEDKLLTSIHMIFVFFPIELLFLDKNQIVVDKVTLTPFTLNYTPKKKAKFVVELPVGTTKRVELGEKITWEKKKLRERIADGKKSIEKKIKQLKKSKKNKNKMN